MLRPLAGGTAATTLLFVLLSALAPIGAAPASAAEPFTVQAVHFKVTIDDPDWDGKAGKQLISYLGGASGIGFADDTHATPLPPLDVVRLDGPGDPRVGMLGGSYGGQIQFAIASIDDRLDTIVPYITWSDLSYALAPNNTAQTTGVSTSTPGTAKLFWALGFSGIGSVGSLPNAPKDPERYRDCPNFAAWVCPALVNAAAPGTLDEASIGHMRSASVASYVSKVRIPTLVIQGQNDTLFNLNEGTANYQALQAQGTETKLIWYSGGHSGATAPGDFDPGSPDPASQVLTARVVNWMSTYLKDSGAGTGPEFSYFRDWVGYSGSAAAAYANASSYPAGTTSTWFLSQNSLIPDAAEVKAGSQSLLTPASAPSSSDPLDVISSLVPFPLPESDLPGTAATWTTPTLTRPVDVVGSPVAHLRVGAPISAQTQSRDAGKLVLFLKILDVGPDGSSTLVRNQVAPVRVPDVRRPFEVTLPAFVHRFATGHRLRLVVAGGSTNYRGGLIPTPVSITTAEATTGRTALRARASAGPVQSLRLPVLDDTRAVPPLTQPAAVAHPAPAAQPQKSQPASQAAPQVRTAAAPATRTGVLPDTVGPESAWLFCGALLVAMGLDLLRRHGASGDHP